MKKLLKRIVDNPYLNIIVGLIFCLSGLLEAWGTLGEDLKNMNIGVHHGAIIYGLFHALKNVPDLFEGLEYIQMEEV